MAGLDTRGGPTGPEQCSAAVHMLKLLPKEDIVLEEDPDLGPIFPPV